MRSCLSGSLPNFLRDVEEVIDEVTKEARLNRLTENEEKFWLWEFKNLKIVG